MMTVGTWAVPAKRGLWNTFTTSDGTEVTVQLMGDEHMHFWQSEDGRNFTMQDDGTLAPADMPELKRHAAARRALLNTRQHTLRSPRRVEMGEQTHYTGQKKGIVILMNFKDTKFKTANNLAKYKDILNKENYTTSPFKGSVADYFKAQSGGQFELTFDVVGPYTAKNNYSYYGKDVGSEGDDQHADELIVEAVKAADAEVNFRDYDWDGDDEVDQVFVVYAGKGQANGGNNNTIWPHMWFLSEYGMAQTLDGVLINTYACSSELNGNGNIDGVGTFCHEFSHCLGFPDFYDTSYSGWFGMGHWDLMDAGSYNDDGYKPAGYNAYEKWMAGWIEPVELDKDAVTIENLKTTSNGGEAYIIYNDGNHNEYYMVENRQQNGWDAYLPGKGLMIVHVDFDKDIWEQNTPNTKVTSSDAAAYGYKVNDHQRFTIFHADNTESSYYGEATDLYPYSFKDSLTNTSNPAASLYNKNTDGKKFMNKPITKIKQNSDGTMSFVFNGGPQVPPVNPDDPDDPDDPGVTVITAKGDTLFYESFNLCAGTGGNDNKWNGNVAQSTFKPDNANWSYKAAYSANKCARFGNGTKPGDVTTPTFSIEGEATLTFKAAAWDAAGDGNDLTLKATNGVTLSETQLTMPKGEWGNFTITITPAAKKTSTITFTPSKRFFLDEVLILKNPMTPTGITTLQATGASGSPVMYNLQGQRVSRSHKGLYIVNGKKYIK